MTLVLDFILIGGIVITLLILLILWKSKERQLPQKLLILFFAVLLFYLLNEYADLHDLDVLYVITFPFSDCIEIFLGPLIFIYIKSLFEVNRVLIKKNWMHFMPSVLYISFINIPFLISIFADKYILNYLKYLIENSEVAVMFLMIYLICYILLSLVLFTKYRTAMLANFSTISDNDFNWVKQMLVGTLIVASVDLLISFYEIFVVELLWDTQYITGSLVILLIGYLGYYGVNQSKVLLPDFLIKKDYQESKSKEKINQLSSFTESEISELKNKLEIILVSERPYLDEELTLGKLAQNISTTDKKLSTLLNQYMNTTFYDLINKYRVGAVKEKLNSPEFDNLTLLGIAYESGFKSKTSFNRIFKKETGLSPSEYKKKL